ncbi:MAG: hypothetical protein GF311_09540 [Candidatus Lokiarchaeota archaeon]|nr:hypothetical protein [Candidatus Lokiarchaeota archaeon]
MQKKFIVILIVSIFFIGGIFAFGLIGFFTYGYIDEIETYDEYQISGTSPSEIGLVFNSDLSDLTIRYNTSAIDSTIAMRIESHIHVEGIFVRGRSFSEFFSPVNIINQTAVKGIEIRRRDLAWFSPTNWFLGMRVNLTVTLRTDLEYNITANIGAGKISFQCGTNTTLDAIELTTGTGDISINAEQVNFTNNIHLGTTLGDISGNFENCSLNGNVSFVVNTGNIGFNAYNFSYDSDSSWDISTIMGNINIDVLQNRTMNYDVELDTIINDIGTLILHYKDTDDTIGAEIRGQVDQGDVTIREPLIGFEKLSETFIQSDDYDSAGAKYDITLRAITGDIDIYAQSS